MNYIGIEANDNIKTKITSTSLYNLLLIILFVSNFGFAELNSLRPLLTVKVPDPNDLRS